MKLAPVAQHKKRFDSLEQEAFLSLWRTYDRLRAIEEQLFDSHDLTAQQYNALRLLRAARPDTIPTLTLASRLISRAPDITRLLDRLHDRGLIDRVRSADNRRVVRVGITPAGLELLSSIADHVRACHARQLGHLGEEDMRALIHLLRRAREPHEAPASAWR
jgi:DNA-binding MarR family transcriptional regulator